MDIGLKELIRGEYETDPDITIDELCAKYRVTRNVLGPTFNWEKVQHGLEEPLIPHVTTEIVEKPKTPKDTISEFKTLTLEEALTRLKTQGSMLPIRDLKELVAIIDTIDKSYSKSTDVNQINIVIQNMISKFEDDC